jgi:uncharacterized beta-barrel protein YwiB (DUF1934 family)
VGLPHFVFRAGLGNHIGRSLTREGATVVLTVGIESEDSETDGFESHLIDLINELSRPDGYLTHGDNGYTVRFTEVQEGGEAHTNLYVTDGGVRLVKTGAISSEMVFSEGKDFNTLYRVGPYSFDMVVRTKRIRNSLSEDGGELQLIYSMNVGGQEKNVRMKISAKRK